jgi:hypothetical protein
MRRGGGFHDTSRNHPALFPLHACRVIKKEKHKQEELEKLPWSYVQHTRTHTHTRKAQKQGTRISLCVFTHAYIYIYT